MRCHYEVLELTLTATSEEIKKAYRRLSLKFHPDRNIGDEAVASENFKEISASYEVLSDPQEKKWYDDHRESIIRGGNKGSSSNGTTEFEDVTKSQELWKYFSTSCYTTTNDDDGGFYKVYTSVFENIYSMETSNENGLNLNPAPSFGSSSTSDKETILFYSFWTNFITVMSFSFVDKYNPNEAPNRAVKRAIEKDNKKDRDIEKKKYVDLIRALALYVKKRDPRIKEIELKSLQNEEEEVKKRLEQKKNSQKLKKLNREKYANDEDEMEKRRLERTRAFCLADEANSDDDEEEDEDDDNRINNCKKNSRNNNNRSSSSSSIYNNDDDENDNQVDAEVEGFLRKKMNSLSMSVKSAAAVNRSSSSSSSSNGNSSKASSKSTKSSPITMKRSTNEVDTTTATVVQINCTNSSDNNHDGTNTVINDTKYIDTINNTLNKDTDDDDDEDDKKVVETILPSSSSSYVFIPLEYACELCEKQFKTAAQLNQHFNHRTHKKKEQDLRKLEKKISTKVGGSSIKGIKGDDNSLNIHNNSSVVEI